MAIFGPQTSPQTDFVIDIANKVKIPIISPATSPSLSPHESPYFIRSSWRSSSQAKAVAAIVKHFGWREVVLVHEDATHKLGSLPFLTQYLSENGAFVSNTTAVSLSADKDLILEKLKELKRMQTRVFVVHMAQPLASRFFKLARGAGMMEEGYVWIVSGLITGLLDWESVEAMQGVVGVRAYFRRSREVRRFETRWRRRFYAEYMEVERPEMNVFGLWAYDSMTALSEAVEGVDVTYPHFKKGVSMGNVTFLEEIGISKNGPKVAHLMRNFRSEGLSGDFVIENGELQPSVFEIVNVIGDGAKNTVGFWREDGGISMRPGGDDGGRRRHGVVVWPGQTSVVPRGWDANGKGKKLRVGVPLKGRTIGLISVEVDEETKEIKNASGFCIDVFEEVMRSMHVEFEYAVFNNVVGNSTGFNYDGLIEQVFLEVI